MGSGLFGRLEQELDAREKTPGLTMADVLSLPDDLRRLVNWMMRQEEVTWEEIAAFVGQDEAAARSMLATLLEKGFLREIQIRGATSYRVRLAPRRKREVPLNIWQSLDDKVEE